VRGFSPPHNCSGRPVEGGRFVWRGDGRHEVVAHHGGLRHRDSGGCQGCGLGTRRLCPLRARDGSRPLSPKGRAPLGAPRGALEVGRRSSRPAGPRLIPGDA
jgi:hypothetical protein